MKNGENAAMPVTLRVRPCGRFAPTAAYLGIANMLQGHRGDDDLTITVTTHTRDGLIWPSRSVQIHWQKWDKAALDGPDWQALPQ